MRSDQIIDNYDNRAARTPYVGSEYIDNEDFTQGRGMNTAGGRNGAGGGYNDERYVVRV